jgi:hypothetical protein
VKALASLALPACAFSRRERLGGAGILVVLNVAALVVVVRATGLPQNVGEAAFLCPTLVAIWLQGRLLANCERDGRSLRS